MAGGTRGSAGGSGSGDGRCGHGKAPDRDGVEQEELSLSGSGGRGSQIQGSRSHAPLKAWGAGCFLPLPASAGCWPSWV